MRGRRIINRKPEKARLRKTPKAERSTTSKTARAKSSVASLQKQLERQALELEEARQQQAASSEVLHIISASPGALTPVFKAIVKSAVDLCGARFGAVFRMEGDLLHLVTDYNFGATQRQLLGAMYPMAPNRGHISGRAILTGSAVQIPDIYADENYKSVEAKKAGFRSLFAAPLLQSGRAIGSIVIYRTEPGAFTARQSALLQTFADQAVIAIENARLFSETKEALERQTATADILKVIASSPSDVQPVFEAIVHSAARLFEPCGATITTLKDGQLHWNATAATLPGFDTERAKAIYPIPFDPERAPSARAILERRIIEIPDIAAPDTPEFTRKAAAAGGFQSIIFVPLIKQDKGIGTIILTHLRAGFKLSEKQLALVGTFSDQAVIAIENARLFNETKEALEQQTATSEVLKAISSSPGELEPVFNAMLENAVRICEAKFGNLLLIDGDNARWAAGVGTPLELAQYLQSASFRPTPGSHLDRVMRTKQVSHATDDTTEAVIGASARLGGARSTVCVPMVKDEALVGAIFMYRTEVRPFTEKQIDLVKNFAAQAVIAIENTRLLNELRERTAELSQSLDELRTAQDRLIQTEKLASLGQLTAGIAHEIKNPLNFVNNFSALSAELVGEMNAVLAGATLDKKARGELDELAQTLKSNLEKVVQHGKRADSIVKNMLQHSREGSGEHRPTDINALVDESLNLAYHGARAEKAGFSIAFQRDLDPSVGMADIYPQEITRVLLNLISNGFYATTKRKAEAGDGFEPMLFATTKNLGDKVEIRIRDNGTGISDEVKGKIFNPFFTTKPSGEGTGLGLSMSHDIIVKQHGGSIDVETEPGLFTEFKIVLPRTSQR